MGCLRRGRVLRRRGSPARVLRLERGKLVETLSETLAAVGFSSEQSRIAELLEGLLKAPQRVLSSFAALAGQLGSGKLS